MHNDHYPLNLIRTIYGDDITDNTHTETTYIKGLYEQLETLNEKEQAILSMRYKDGASLKACGERYDMKYQHVRQIHNTAMRKLRQRFRTKHYEAAPRAELESLESQYQKVDKENQQLKEALYALGGCNIDPHMVVLLAKIIQPQHLDTNIGELGLSTRAFNGLRRSGIFTIKDVIAIPEEKFIGMQSIGEKTAQEIKSKIKTYILLPTMYQTEQEDSHESNTL